MAGAALTPRVRIIAVCDGVKASKSEDGVFNLKGVRQSLSVPAFPFVANRLSLFMVLSSPRPGLFPGYIRVVSASTDKAILFNYLSPSPRFEQDVDFIAVGPRLRCSFPEPGRYLIEVCFFQEQGSDVVKGELPLVLVKREA